MNLMQPPAEAPIGADDLRALAWISEEVRRSLDNAQKALRRHVKEAAQVSGSDLDVVDPAVLRGARVQLHQASGALEVVGAAAPARVLQACELVVQRMIARPAKATEAVALAIEQASFAVLDFMDRQVSGRAVSGVALFPQYRVLVDGVGADRVHPADLWELDWHWLELPPEAGVVPLPVNEQARAAMEPLMLRVVRKPDRKTLRRMSDLCAALGAGSEHHQATLWRLASAVFQGLATELLRGDVYVKRTVPRLLAQTRGQGTTPEVAERLARDLLFFCARSAAPSAERPAPRLEAVRKAWGLDEQTPVPDYSAARLGRFDPALIAQARKRVATAREAWSAVAGADMHRLGSLSDVMTLVEESLERLYPSGAELARALSGVAAQVVRSGQAPPAPLAMEVATSVLYIEASLEDGDLDHPELGARVQRMAKRIDAANQGQPPEPLDPWMEELYRRVSDQQTMGSVVQELRSSLSEVEKQIDQYFRNPAQRELLYQVPATLSSMRGVLSVLGMDHASQAVLRMRSDVDSLAQGGGDPEIAAEAGTFDRLADNLGALSFLIDMLNVQPQLVKSLFRYDAYTGSLRAVMGLAKRAPVQPDLKADPSRGALRSEMGALDSGFGSMPQDPGMTILDSGPATLTDLPEFALQPIPRPAQPASALAVPLAVSSAASLAAAAAVARPAPALSAVAALAATAPPLEAPSWPEPAATPDEIAPTEQGGLDEAGVEPTLDTQPPPAAPQMAPPFAQLAPAPAPGADDEMREIFFEEAREVVQDAQQALARLVRAVGDEGAGLQDMTVIRRAYHTLKGSARMVGLNEYGEAAWACEQLYNARLSQGAALDAPLKLVTEQTLNYMGSWVESIADARDGGHQAAAVIKVAEALRLEGRLEALALPSTGAAVMALSGLAASAAAAAPSTLSDAHLLDLALRTVAQHGAGDAGKADALARVPTPDVEDVAFDRAQSSWDTEPADSAMATTQVLPYLPTPPSAMPEVPEMLDMPADLSVDVPQEDGAASWPLRAAPTPDAQLAPPREAPAADSTFDPISLSAPMPLDGAEDLEGMDFFDLDLDLPTAAPARAVPEEPVQPSLAFDTEQVAAVPSPIPDAPAPAPAPAPAAVVNVATAAKAEPDAWLDDDQDQIKIIGDLRIDIPMFNIYLNEADELSRRLGTELAEWAVAPDFPPGESVVVLAHSLAGSSGTVGFADLSALSRALEHALMRSNESGAVNAPEAALFINSTDEIRRLLHQFAAGFLMPVQPGLIDQLDNFQPTEQGSQSQRADLVDRGLATPDLRDFAASAPGEFTDTAATAARAQLDDTPAAVVKPEVLLGMDKPSDVAEAPDVAPEPAFERPALEALAPLAPAALAAALVAAVPASAQTRADRQGSAFEEDDDLDAVDSIDPDLFPIFAEEAQELLPQLQSRVRDWTLRPQEGEWPAACMRTLHTFKGGARLAGAMRLGEMAHRMETSIEHLLADGDCQAADLERLTARADALQAAFETLLNPAASAAPVVELAAAAPVAAHSSPVQSLGLAVAAPSKRIDASDAAAQPTAALALQSALPSTGVAHAMDWSRFDRAQAAPVAAERSGPAPAAMVRVRAPLLDRLVNHAGEVSIARARIDSDVSQIKTSLADLTDNLERLRSQLRDLELQGESQINSRMEAAKAAAQEFDPLEMDRFTRFQEITRMMAESVNDVGTVHRGLLRTVQSTEDELAAQARLTRGLQDDLLRTRMVEFESLSDRLYRVVRQASKETGKQVRLDIVGGSTEIDRGVLDRMIGPFEHLLRNSVSHGIELPAVRLAQGKEATGSILVSLHQEGNEVALEFRDDGAGLNLQRIRERAQTLGLVAPGAALGDADWADLIFTPGFSTASEVTELSGRGVGMDVVRSEVLATGGRIETATTAGQGTRFRLVLPLTTAVTQVVLLRCGELTVAVPSTLAELVRRAPVADVENAYRSGAWPMADGNVPFFWLGALLEGEARGALAAKGSVTVVVIRSAAQRVALHVDEVLGNQEVVVKNLGTQLARLPGLAGVTLLPSGQIMPIYNPVALASLYGAQARLRLRSGAGAAPEAAVRVPEAAEVALAPLVMVVDDSLTVRRVTQRMLVREGYRVVTAKDGLDALERLTEERPAVVLSDIEMPRMDGFDLVRNLRADARFADLPVIMITSRIAQKHREYAKDLGVEHYLGKPYGEEELLALVARYARSNA